MCPLGERTRRNRPTPTTPVRATFFAVFSHWRSRDYDDEFELPETCLACLKFEKIPLPLHSSLKTDIQHSSFDPRSTGQNLVQKKGSWFQRVKILNYIKCFQVHNSLPHTALHLSNLSRFSLLTSSEEVPLFARCKLREEV